MNSTQQPPPAPRPNVRPSGDVSAPPLQIPEPAAGSVSDYQRFVYELARKAVL